MSGSTPKMAERFLRAYGLEHVLSDPRFSTNEARVTHAEALDTEVREAVSARTLDENVEIIDAHHLTAAPVQTVARIEQDPHWQTRGLTLDVPAEDAPVRMHAVIPRLSNTPGQIRWAGGALGQDNAAVYGEFGLTDGDLSRLAADGVI